MKNEIKKDADKMRIIFGRARRKHKDTARALEKQYQELMTGITSIEYQLPKTESERHEIINAVSQKGRKKKLRLLYNLREL